MPRFVLLYHECPPGFTKPSHWDFMLEADGVLQTWELRDLPHSWQDALHGIEAQEDQTVVATRIADHRLDYLAYEGLLTENRGSVTRVAQGTFDAIETQDNRLTVRLHGQTIHGVVVLTHTAETDEWQLSADD